MNRSCVWIATLTAATLTMPAAARAFTAESPKPAQQAPVPEQPSAKSSLGKQTPPGTGGYNFSGSSFNLSVTRNGRNNQPEPPKVTAPVVDPDADKPGFFRRMLNWITGD